MKRIRLLLIVLGAAGAASLYLSGWSPLPPAPPPAPRQSPVLRQNFPGHPRPKHPPIPGPHLYVDDTISHTA